MGRDGWYRNESWEPEVAAVFEDKLARSRKKDQYLRIQAGCLAKSDPEVALQLLDRYFDTGDTFFLAQAHADRAAALVALRRTDEAIVAYDAALQRETEFPSVRTRAFLELPYLVATQPVPVQFDRATSILRGAWDQLVFPVDHFMANASLALIADSFSRDSGDAARYAAAAIEAASQDESGLPHHKELGLVGDDQADVLGVLRSLVDRANGSIQ